MDIWEIAFWLVPALAICCLATAIFSPRMKAKPILLAITGTMIGTVPNFWASDGIPCHSFLLGLTLPELTVALWLLLAPILLGRADVPKRWWIYFGLTSYLVMWPTIETFVLTIYPGNRRPWMPSDYALLKFLAFGVCFSLVPLIGITIKEERAKAKKTHKCEPSDAPRPTAGQQESWDKWPL